MLTIEINNQIEQVVASARKYGRHSVIALAGVPGTGKSYIAEKAALRITGHLLFVKTVQFHPGFTYEDFVEGFRPVPGGFSLKDGLLLEINEQALRDPQNTYVLLIEELTRANISAVLGELLTYVEYRERSFTLPSGRQLQLAENLVFLATYNPTDRSALELDDAIIRRLRIISIPPSAAALSGLLPKTTPAQVAFANSLTTHFSNLCATYSEDGATPLPFGHAVFRNLESYDELKILWNEQLKYILRRPSLPPHPLADEIESLVEAVQKDMKTFELTLTATLADGESGLSEEAVGITTSGQS